MSAIDWSFHTHSAYCDGEGSLEDVVQAALMAGLHDLGFSSHAPLPFATEWNMSLDRIDGYCSEVRRLQSTYGGRIRLWLGAELDYIPLPEVEELHRVKLARLGFDYFVGSVHFLGDSSPPASFDGTAAEFDRILASEYRGDIREMSADYYGRVGQLPGQTNVRIIGHFDLIKRWNWEGRYFREDERWYRSQVEGALASVAEGHALVELNTAGWRKQLGDPYPSPWILDRCRELGIPVTVSSDAHTPKDLTWGYAQAQALLRSLGMTPTNPAGLMRSECISEKVPPGSAPVASPGGGPKSDLRL